MRRSIALTLALGPLALAGCGGPSVDRPATSGFQFDAGADSPPPSKPNVAATPAKVPFPVATLHGTALAAKRVIVDGADNPLASTVLPDGTFCVDVPMRSASVYRFELIAQGGDGRVSEPAGPISIEFDPAAPGVQDASTCNGSDPAGCAGSVEVCGNGRDDDCNGLVDDSDPACAACKDDALEPNDDATAPRIEPGRYDSLRICPNNPDYYGVTARANDLIDLRLYFDAAMGNLDVSLFARDTRRLIARGMNVGSDETLTYTATVAGEYVIEVYSDMGASNAYTLDLRVGP
jgi:pre-peptidase